MYDGRHLKCILWQRKRKRGNLSRLSDLKEHLFGVAKVRSDPFDEILAQDGTEICTPCEESTLE